MEPATAQNSSETESQVTVEWQHRSSLPEHRRVTLGAKGAKMCTQAPAPGYINVYPGAAACLAQALAPGYTMCTQAPAPAYTMCTQAPAPGYTFMCPGAGSKFQGS